MLYYCFGNFNQSLLDLFNPVDVQLVLTLLYDSMNLVVIAFHLWVPYLRRTETDTFAL